MDQLLHAGKWLFVMVITYITTIFIFEQSLFLCSFWGQQNVSPLQNEQKKLIYAL